MLAYTKNEMVSSTEVVRNFSSLLDSLKTKKRNKIAIMRKNNLEAILLPIEEYERLQACIDHMENLEIEKILNKRRHTPLTEYLNFDQVLADHGLENDDL